MGKKALVLLMNDEWVLHRRVMTKAFHWEHLKGMVGDMCAVGHSLVARFKAQHCNEPCNVCPILKLATLDAIGLTAFGYQFDTVLNGTHKVATAFEWLLDETSRRPNPIP